jgi:hypothetical protein
MLPTLGRAIKKKTLHISGKMQKSQSSWHRAIE